MARGTKRLRAKGMPPEVKAYYRAEVRSITDRIGTTPCEARLAGIAHACRGTLDSHHVQKRSQFGKRRWREAHARANLLRLCRSAHDMTDEPVDGPRGRLVVEALGHEVYRLQVARVALHDGRVMVMGKVARYDSDGLKIRWTVPAPEKWA